MPRRKLPSSVSPNMVWEQCVKKNVNPVEEMIKLATMKIPIPVGYDEDALKKMMDRYDIQEIGGKDYLIPKVADRFDVWKELAQYCAPKLRSSETTTTEDKNITITIRSFDSNGKAHILDLKETKLLE